ncbi:MAG: hypothetical protein ACR2JH_09500 [Solirubrobacteraceae bacterium]
MLSLLCLAALLGGAVLVAVIQPAKAVEDASQSITELEAVSATSATDAWSVGFREGQALILHGDGRGWSPVATPRIGKLFGVSARSASDAWAVGDASVPGSHTLQTAVLHWDGLTWTRVPSPSPSTFYNQLYGVVAVSPQDAWAVGYSLSPGRAFHSLLLHWNGAKWSTVRVPGVELDAVDAVSSRNVWAVGDQILLHWNGTRWSRQTVRTRDFLQSLQVIKLVGVSAVSPTNVWAVGHRCANLGTCIPRTEIIHWNGRHWSTVRSPAPSRWFNVLSGVRALSSRDAWAVGAYCNGSKCSPERTLTVHWDGRRWSTVPSPNPSSSLNLLAGIGAASPTEMWAVGARTGGSSGTDTLMLDWNGTRWSAG